MKKKITTSMQKWIIQAQKKPHVSRMAFPINHPLLKIVLFSVDADDCLAAQSGGAVFFHKGSAPEEVLAVLEPLLSSQE